MILLEILKQIQGPDDLFVRTLLPYYVRWHESPIFILYL